ncbi:hypothetical protein MWH28_09145 [Natroniella sulfidigena]|uniref:hypothetical protein n=1 Tax=Natroniella sulfidigena TaxID=723921 RepID=UPI00200B509E|nr:hypothetical protein [Natroniella sulfidigena]MCK8817520.1 hypothetical protein [Natroniella sulfidigena]
MKRYILLLVIIIVVGLALLTRFMGDDGYKVSGQVLDNQGQGIEGVTFDFGNFGTVKTDQDGKWSKAGIRDKIKVEPIKEGRDFYPNSIEMDEAKDTLYFVEQEGLDDILIWLSLDPDNEGANYEVSASIRKLNGLNETHQLMDTEILVNGLSLQFDNSDDDGVVSLFSYQEGDLRLETEDKATININHPLLGSTEKEIEVPRQVDDLEVDGDIEAWISEELNNLTLNWSATTSELYKVWITLYDEQKELIGDAVTLVDSDSYTFSDTSWLRSYETDQIATYVEFEVFAVNMYRLVGFNKNSGVEISAKEGPTVSNLPHN